MNFIKKIVIEAINEIGQDASNSAIKDKTRLLLQKIPNAPFAGNMSALSTVVLSNESLEALHKWTGFCEYCIRKFGLPDKWPPKAAQIASQLAKAVESQTGQNSNGQFPKL